MMKSLSTYQHLRSKPRRHSPTQRALLGLCGLFAVGSPAAACGSAATSKLSSASHLRDRGSQRRRGQRRDGRYDDKPTTRDEPRG